MILAWDERHGRVSRAFSDWRVVDRDQRALLAFGLRMARARLTTSSGEVYVEGAHAELVGGATTWTELTAFFATLGVGIDSDGVGAVRDLRDALTSRRAQRPGVELGEADVIAAMDVLADRAREIDAAVWVERGRPAATGQHDRRGAVDSVGGGSS